MPPFVCLFDVKQLATDADERVVRKAAFSLSWLDVFSGTPACKLLRRLSDFASSSPNCENVLVRTHKRLVND